MQSEYVERPSPPQAPSLWHSALPMPSQIIEMLTIAASVCPEHGPDASEFAPSGASTTTSWLAASRMLAIASSAQPKPRAASKTPRRPRSWSCIPVVCIIEAAWSSSDGPTKVAIRCTQASHRYGPSRGLVQTFSATFQPRPARDRFASNHASCRRKLTRKQAAERVGSLLSESSDAPCGRIRRSTQSGRCIVNSADSPVR